MAIRPARKRAYHESVYRLRLDARVATRPALLRAPAWLQRAGLLALGVILVQGCDCTGAVVGGGSLPAAPTVDTPTTVCSAVFTASGGKPSSTSLHIDGAEAVPFDELTTWNAQLTVADGMGQTYLIEALDSAGRKSAATEYTVVVQSAVPADPTVDPIALMTDTSPLTITGTKEAGSGIVVNGVEVVPVDDLTTFTGAVTLTPGNNSLAIVASNGCQESNVITRTIFYDAPYVNVTIDFPLDGSFVSGPIMIAGTADTDDTLTLVEVRIDGGAWTAATGLASWTFAWDPTSLMNFTTHTIEARAFDSRMMEAPNVSVSITLAGDVVVLSQANGRRPAIAVSGTDAYLVWHDTTTADNEIRATIVSGGSMPVATLISDDMLDGNSQNARVAVDAAGIMHIVWEDSGSFDLDNTEDDDIVYATFDGMMVGATTLVSVEGMDLATADEVPDIAIDAAGTLHLVWESDRQVSGDTDSEPDILYSQDSGTGWSTPELVSTADTPATNPRLTVDSAGNVHVVWQCRGVTNPMGCDMMISSGCIDLCHRERNDLGAWSGETMVSDSPTENSTLADIAADPGSPNQLVHIVWVQAIQGMTSEILTRTKDAGAFGPPVTLSDDAADNQAVAPTVAVDAMGNAAFAFATSGDVQSSGTDLDIFSRRMTPALGAYEAISDPDSNATNTGLSTLPSAAMSSTGNLYITWEDRTDIDMNATPDVFLLIR